MGENGGYLSQLQPLLASEGVSWRSDRSKELLTVGRVSNPLQGERMIVSKLTSKAQATIPKPIRAALGLQPGDELLYEIADGRVVLNKVQRGAATDDPLRTFEEWRPEADTRAYADP